MMLWYVRHIPDKSYEYSAWDWAKTLEGCIEHRELVCEINKTICYFYMHPAKFIREYCNDFHAMMTDDGRSRLITNFLYNEMSKCTVFVYEANNTHSNQQKKGVKRDKSKENKSTA